MSAETLETVLPAASNPETAKRKLQTRTCFWTDFSGLG